MRLPQLNSSCQVLAGTSHKAACFSLQGFSNGMPEQPDMHATIFKLAVMHGGNRTYSAMQKLYLEVCSPKQTSLSFRCRKGDARSALMMCAYLWISQLVLSPKRVL